MQAFIVRLLKSDSAFALAIILPTLGGIAVAGYLEYIVISFLRHL